MRGRSDAAGLQVIFASWLTLLLPRGMDAISYLRRGRRGNRGFTSPAGS